MSETQKDADKTLRAVDIGAAPDTHARYVNTDEQDVEVTVVEKHDGSVTISGSAWDETGMGVGGVSIRVAEDKRDELAEMIRGGE